MYDELVRILEECRDDQQKKSDMTIVNGERDHAVFSILEDIKRLLAVLKQ